MFLLSSGDGLIDREQVLPPLSRESGSVRRVGWGCCSSSAASVGGDETRALLLARERQ
jgi:hypothetical protein